MDEIHETDLKGKTGVPSDPRALATEQIDLRVEGATITFNVSQGLSGPALFGLGVRKSGSTMLNRILSYLAARNIVNVVDLPGTFFRKGLVATEWATINLDDLIRPGNLYLGFRAFPPKLADSALFAEGRKVFMFRDPRDALVSQYFSDAYSHAIPAKSESIGSGRDVFLKKRETALSSSIDDYVIKHAKALHNTLDRYTPMLDDPSCLCLRYEDYIFQKRRLIYKIVKHFGWTIKPGQVNALLQIVDTVPQAEDKTRFIRKAIPGDHQEKLTEDTKRKINRILQPILDRYDYY